MAIAVLANPLDLTSRIQTFVGRHADKSFDWDAFPGSRGHLRQPGDPPDVGFR